MTEETKKEETYQEPSEEFRRAVIDGGGCRAECPFCHRTFFSSEGGYDWEEGELEGLKANEAKDPDNYIDLYFQDPATGHLDGRRVVVDCPCNYIRRYEDWIWGHRYMIADYLEARIIKMEKDADIERKMVLKKEGRLQRKHKPPEPWGEVAVSQDGLVDRIRRTRE